jgi:hypothetical protein
VQDPRTLRKGWWGRRGRKAEKPSYGLDDAFPTGAPLGRVQDAQADAVAAERRARRAVHPEGDAAVGAALDAPVPVEADEAEAVTGPEPDPERLGLGLDLEVVEHGGDGEPGLVPHGRVDPAQDLALPQPYPAQLAAVEDEP